MASAKIIEDKQNIVDEITKKFEDSKSVLVFSYQGLTVAQMAELRRELKKEDSEVKIYKNSLVKRALDAKNINIDSFLEGPNAIVFGKEVLEPIKILRLVLLRKNQY